MERASAPSPVFERFCFILINVIERSGPVLSGKAEAKRGEIAYNEGAGGCAPPAPLACATPLLDRMVDLPPSSSGSLVTGDKIDALIFGYSRENSENCVRK